MTTEFKKSLLCILGLGILVAAFFRPILTGEAFFWNDFAESFYPFRAFAATELQAGRFPLWNPYLAGGTPFFAVIDNAVLYPLNWLFIPLVQDGFLNYIFVEWHVIAHFFLLGVGMFLFCRHLGISRSGAFLAGISWMFSGPVVHHIIHGAMIYTIAWLPFIMIMLDRTLDRLCLRHALATGALWGIAIFAGHPQIFMYMAYTMGLYCLARMINRIRAADHTAALRMGGLFMLVMVTGIGLSAVVFLPTYEMVGYSERSETSFALSATYSFDPRQFITLLMPDFYGQSGPAIDNYWGPYKDDYGHYWETFIYLGLLPILIAGAAIVIHRTWTVIFFGILSGMSILFIFLYGTPLFKIIYAIVPGFSNFRAHVRIGIIMGFAVAVLVGFGFDALRSTAEDAAARQRLKRYIMLVGGLIFIGALCFFVMEQSIIGWLAPDAADLDRVRIAFEENLISCALLILLSFILLSCWLWQRRNVAVLAIAVGVLITWDLFQAGASFNRSSEGPEVHYPYNDLVRNLQAQQHQEGGRISYRAGTVGLLKRNAGTVFRISAIEGYASPLRLSPAFPPTTTERMFDLMNVTYHIHLLEDGRATFVHNADALPRAFIVRKYVVTEQLDDVEGAMADSTFDYRTAVTLDHLPPVAIPADSVADSERPVITAYTPDRMQIQVTLIKPGLLVISESYYPAWRAYVNGLEQPIYRADATMRAIALSAGAHTVELRYESDYMLVGGIISGFCLLVILGIAVSVWRARQVRVGEDTSHSS